MHTPHSLPADQAQNELLYALAQVGNSREHLRIETHVVNERGDTLSSQHSGKTTDRKIVFFSRCQKNTPERHGSNTRLRLWGVLLKRSPVFLDHFRQIANELTRYKAPKSAAPALQISAAGASPKNSSSRKTAVIAMHWLDVGGAEKFAIDSAELASKMGFRVVVICDKPGPLTWLTRIEPFTECIYMLGDLDHLARRSVCLQLALDIAPEIVHIHHCETVYELLPTIRERGLDALVLDSTHIIENRHGGFVAASQRYSPWIDFHHVISRTLQDFYVEAGISPEKIQLGYLLKKICLPNNSEIPISLHSPLRVGFIGRMAQQKRPYLFVELARRLNRLAPKSFRFEMIGEGILEHQVKEQVKTDKVLVDIHSSQSDVNKFLSEIDVLVICSDQEGLTLVAFEAVTNGCAVISTDVGAQRELLDSLTLLPVAPYKFLRAATELLLKIAKEQVNLQEIKAKQLERYVDLLAQRSAIDTCASLYGKALSFEPEQVASHE